MTTPLTIVDVFGARDPWNAFVSASPVGHLFQSWEWGELQDGLGGRPVRIAAMAGDEIRGCVQALIFEGASKRFAYVPRGPVAAADDHGPAGSLMDAIIRVSAAAETALVRVEPQWTFHPDQACWLEQRGFARARQFIMPRRTILVDLRPSLDDIWRGFRSNTRNRIRLADKRGVEVRVGNEADMAMFTELFKETEARHRLRRSDTAAFALASRHFGRRDTMRLYVARSEGVDIAGIVVFLWGTMATYLWGASSASDAARRLNPNQLLHWTAMQWARARGCKTYDLFGIPDYDADVLEAEYGRRAGGMWNLYRFKRGFGGEVHRPAGTFDYVFRPR